VQFEFLARIQSGRGLVEKQQRGVGRQRPRDLDQALVAVGKA
jgi:hypothetical protein